MAEADAAAAAVKLLNGFQFESFRGEASRKEVLAAARALVTRLETPMETMVHMSHEVPALNAALRVVMNHGVFEKLNNDPSTAKSAEALSSNKNDSALLNRFLKHLAAMNIIKSAGPNLYLPTRHSSAFANPTINAAVDYYRDVTSKAFISLPAFLQHHDYDNPASNPQGNWEYLLGRGESHFAWLANNPEIMKNFGNLMAGYTSQRGSWLDVYPGPALLEGANPDVPVLVDVGGGVGQDLIKYLNRVPESAGSLVLQDLPQVIQEASKSVPLGIIAQDQDIFEAQKIRGARAYFLHSVLHDWPDEKCQQILANLKAAMQPGYSRLLINELMISSSDPTAYGTTLDLTMLALFSAKERSEEDWGSLLEAAGFRIVKIWRGLEAAEAVIEAEPA